MNKLFQPAQNSQPPFRKIRVFLPITLLIIALIGFILLSMYSCNKEEERVNPEKKGNLCLKVNYSLDIKEMDNQLKSTTSTDNFKVIIYHSDGSEARLYENASELPDTIKLDPGEYYVEAHSDNDLPAAFENPYYFGSSSVFTVSSDDLQTIQINCSLGNTVVSVKYSEQIISGFNDYSTSVSNGTDSLIFTKSETRQGYFHPMPLQIRCTLNYEKTDGSLGIKLLTGSIPEPSANHHYEIEVNASAENGGASFLLTLENPEIPKEIIVLNDNPAPLQEGEIARGDLLITEIMSNPDAIADTEGEWFELYNSSEKTINLENLVITRNGTESHKINQSIQLGSGDFYVLQRSATATNVTNAYIYGSDILLPNTGAELSIYNADTGSGSGPLIFSLNYGNSEFPSSAGKSISLNPDRMNAADAVNGINWCLSSSLYNTGDSGTPGENNDICP